MFLGKKANPPKSKNSFHNNWLKYFNFTQGLNVYQFTTSIGYVFSMISSGKCMKLNAVSLVAKGEHRCQARFLGVDECLCNACFETH